MFRRVFLIGIMVLVMRGSIMQLVISNMYCLAHLLLQMQAGPFNNTADDYLANACSFALCVVFLCSLVFKARRKAQKRDRRTPSLPPR